MAVRVRLTRVGSRKNPVWRVVVADQRSPRDGRVIETVGRYNAQTNPSEIVLDGERVRHWIARGAQPSDTVKKLMKTQGLSPTGVTLPPREPGTPAAAPDPAALDAAAPSGGAEGPPAIPAAQADAPAGPAPDADPPTLPDGVMPLPGPDVAPDEQPGAEAPSEDDAPAR